MELIQAEEAELELDELNNLEKKSGFIEVINDEEKQTITQDLAEVKSSSNQNQKKELVANVFSNTDALTGEKIDDFGVVHSELEPIVAERAAESMQALAENKSGEKGKEVKDEKKDGKAGGKGDEKKEEKKDENKEENR